MNNYPGIYPISLEDLGCLLKINTIKIPIILNKNFKRIFQPG